MRHITSTPFGRRPVTAGLLAAQALSAGDSTHPVNKWQVLRDLSRARTCLGLSDRALSLLNALVSFWREDDIRPDCAIVFPSNQTLSLRAHGMAESTLRRHIATLVDAGLITRHDSPNGKRYAPVGKDQPSLSQAFGFDLSPLARRALQFTKLAEEETRKDAALKRLRESVVLMMRDCDKLIAYAEPHILGNWDELKDGLQLAKRCLRRKLDHTMLAALFNRIEALLAQIKQTINHAETEETSGNDDQNERHIHSSTILNFESESAEKICETDFESAQPPSKAKSQVESLETLPLTIVVEACPEIRSYALNGLYDWQDLIQACDFMHPMIGIPAALWHEAKAIMGARNAAITLAAILQNYAKIKNPGGYLRSLCQGAEQGRFTPAPMIMALSRMANQRML